MVRSLNQGAARLALGLFVGGFALPALAHPGAHHDVAGFTAGLLHPLSGWDHLLAMLAVGIWAAQQRRALSWALPLLFPLAMAAGALLALHGPTVPMLETGIAASVAVLGLLIAFAVRARAASGAIVVSAFAMLHGYAHGIEIPAASTFGSYAGGFLTATLLLHLAGLTAAVIMQRVAPDKMVRVAGGGVLAAGMYLLAAVA